ncbi:MAG TPA: 8-oxo-dGTP diphosphatase [Candidatus Paceibacterota bacterium]
MEIALRYVTMNADRRKEIQLLTLAIVHQSPKVLLGLKKRGFGEGRWNGFGGKVEEGEDLEEAARREIEEECGITPKNLIKLGELTFDFQDEPALLEVHLFKVLDFAGEPLETDEMRPIWFHEHEIPFDSMWKDDYLWFPYFLTNRKFKASFLFDNVKDNNIIEHEIIEVADFENA